MRAGKRTNSSGIEGVYWKKQKEVYEAVIKVNGKSVYLGRSKDYDEACKIRKQGEEKYYKPMMDKIEKDGPWKYIKDYEGTYKINPKGNIVTIRNGKLEYMKMNKKGKVQLRNNQGCTEMFVGRLVMETFGPPKPEEYEAVVRYKDKNRNNPNINNLYWGRKGKYTNKVTSNGEEYESVAELTRHMGFKDRNSIYRRVRNGWNKQDAYDIPRKVIDGGIQKKLYEYEGKWYSVYQLSEMTGIKLRTIRRRIKDWRDISLVINVPVGKRKLRGDLNNG